MLVPMTKVQVLGSTPRLEPALQALHRLQVIELAPWSPPPELPVVPMPEDEHAAEQAERLLLLRGRVEDLLGLAPAAAATTTDDDDAAAEGKVPPPPTESLTAVADELAEIEPAVAALRSRLDRLHEEAESLPQQRHSLRRLLPLLPELVELATYDTVVLMLDRRHAAVLDQLRRELDTTAGPDHAVLTADVDSDTLGVALLMPRQAAMTVEGWLSRERLSQLRMPAEVVGRPIADAIARTQAREEAVRSEIAAAEAQLAAVLQPHVARLLAAQRFLDELLDRVDARRLTGALGQVFVISGWVPEPRLEELSAGLARDVGADVAVSPLPLDDRDRDSAPLLLRNPRPARPFESLVRLLGLPRYGTTDPTVLTAVGVPLFFGVMLGDVAYGLLLLGAATLAHRRLAERPGIAHDLAHVLRLGALWAIGWGVVFGEVLGDLGRRWGLAPLWVNREEAIGPLLVAAAGVGLLHVTLGLCLGVHTARSIRNRRDLTRRLALLGCLAGLALLATGATGLLPRWLLAVGVAGALGGLGLLVVSDGAIGLMSGPLEVIGTLSNVLSYLRLGALGIASAYLARTANELAALPDSVVIGALLAVLLHALNLVLGTFSPAVQALRLHYVEFFGKFFEPGGRAFAPFGGAARRHPAVLRLDGR